jgi:hypothetical protein
MKKHKYISYDGESSGVSDIVIEELPKCSTLTTLSYNGNTEFTILDHGNGMTINDTIELNYSEVADFYIAMTCIMHSGNFPFQVEISRKVKKVTANWSKGPRGMRNDK